MIKKLCYSRNCVTQALCDPSTVKQWNNGSLIKSTQEICRKSNTTMESCGIKTGEMEQTAVPWTVPWAQHHTHSIDTHFRVRVRNTLHTF